MPYLLSWQSQNRNHYQIEITDRAETLKCGDILFLVSCTQIVGADIRNLFKHTLVLHASDLPRGRGWSPHVWEILAGSNELTLSLINAEDKVDTGAIWAKQTVKLSGHELYEEINDQLFRAELALISWACENFDQVKPTAQGVTLDQTYPKRTPANSELDIDESIRSQFNLLRVCDPVRYPAFFKLNGHKYLIKIEKYD